MIKVEIEEPKRLDLYLAEQLEMSRSKIQKLIKEEKITVDGKKASSSYLVKQGDQIEIEEKAEEEMDVEKENIPLNIVYEDNDLLIINKESGMVVHPAPGHYQKTLVNALLYRFDLTSGSKERPGIVHRLDKDTSGLMIVAKNEWAHDKLATMIANKEVKRSYLAIVEGVMKEDSGTIDAPIGRDPKNRQKMTVTDINAKNALTHFKVLERFSNNTLIECILETGRTHQIRVHLAYIGHPVTNDPIYGRKKATDFGQMLHSKKIEFYHPRTKKILTFEAEAPKEFLEKLEELKSKI